MSTTPYLQFVSALVDQGREAIKMASAEIDIPFIVDRDPRAGAVYEHLLHYVITYDGAPTRMTVEGETGVDVGDPPQQPAQYWLEKMRQFRLHAAIESQMGEIQRFMDAGNPDDAYAALEHAVHEINEIGAVESARVTTLADGAQQVFDHYLAIQNGERGVPFPWPTLNTSTYGMWPEALIVFAARSGIGKSWTLAKVGLHAWSQGHRPLFVTTELSQRVVASRLMSLHLAAPYNHINRGLMTTELENDFRAFLNAPPPNIDDFMMIGGNFDFRFSTLAMAVQEAKPDILIVDGAYLLQTEGKDRFDKAAGVFNELKKLGKRFKIPIVTSTQFNRKAELDKESTMTLANIGLTDAAGWNADLVFALFQTEDMRKEKVMKIKNIKGRETWIPDIMANWNFDLMDFSEIFEGGDAAWDSDDVPF